MRGPERARGSSWLSWHVFCPEIMSPMNLIPPTQPPPTNGRPSHFPGFDLLRLLSAAAVLLSHSYLIAEQSEKNEPLARLLGPGQILGHYGVFTFFIISGFLLARSLSYKPSAVVYVTNRSLRILPAFVVCTLVCALVIGPAFSSLRAGDYFTNPHTWGFIGNSLNWLGDAPLPGVFSYDGNDYASVVNGSLWSLRYEALSYLLLFMSWTLLRRSWAVAAMLVGVALATRMSPAVWNALPSLAYTVPFFAGGVFMHWLHSRLGSHHRVAAACAVGLVACGLWGWQTHAFACLGAYLVVYFGERVTFASGWIARMGDCSYGLYLYGWPVQQMVMQTTGTSEPLALFAMSSPFALFMGWISCRLVEQPAMSLRKPLANRLGTLAGKALRSMGRGGIPALIAAKVLFLIAACYILTTRTRWYFFMESMLFILAVTLLTAFVVGFMVKAMLRERRNSGVTAED